MPQKIAIIGAGIVGATIAFRLARSGADVSVIDAALPAAQASGRSFGWINASFHANAAHFALRYDGLDAWRRLCSDLPGLPVSWSGCLFWEEQGAALDRIAEDLIAFGYPVRKIDRAGFAGLEPAMADCPDHALVFPAEGAAETGAVTGALLAAATALGASCMTGCPVTGFATDQGAVTGVITPHGAIAADHVVIAAGTGAPDLLAPLDVALPMLRRPGGLLRTRPVRPVLSHILVAPDQEFRQMPDGAILAPTAASHQGDSAEAISTAPPALLDQTLTRLRQLLPGVDLQAGSLSLAMRPVPQDGLPVIGRAGPAGLYVAVMHSGVTLAPLVAEHVARELLAGEDIGALAPYRPQRFA